MFTKHIKYWINVCLVEMGLKSIPSINQPFTINDRKVRWSHHVADYTSKPHVLQYNYFGAIDVKRYSAVPLLSNNNIDYIEPVTDTFEELGEVRIYKRTKPFTKKEKPIDFGFNSRERVVVINKNEPKLSYEDNLSNVRVLKRSV